MEKLLKLSFANVLDENSKEESKEGEFAVNYDEKKYKVIIDLVTKKASAVKSAKGGLPKGKDFRSFLKK